MRWSWSWGCCHFLSFVFSVNECFVFTNFSFAVFYLWVNSHNITHWQSRHTAWFQIPYLGLCPPSTDWKISLISSAKCLASLIREPIFFQIYTGLLDFCFKLISFFSFLFYRKSMHILFTDRALPTIRCMDKILGKVSLSPCSPKIMVAYGELRIYFAVQIPPFVDWTQERLRWHWVASRSSVEWRSIHQWGITCLIGVVILCTMMIKCVRHQKNAIFTRNFAMSVTPANLHF